MHSSDDAINRRLDMIGRAAIEIAAERSLPSLLQRIVESACEVTGARYGALGVAGDHGEIVEFITNGISPEERARIGPPPKGHGLLGVILRGTRSLRVRRIYEHPFSSGFPPFHPPMTSFLGAPILLRGRNLGNIYLTDKRDAEEFSEEDERLLQVLAAHAAIAIDGARLYEQTSETLAQRIRDLATANAQLQRLTTLVINAQEEERRRISRELHDDTAQALTSVLVRMRLLARTAPDERRGDLLELLELTSGALDGVRRMAIDLRPSTLDDLGLIPAVESYAREFSDRWDIAVRVRAHAGGSRLPRDRELMVYRIIQEALTNTAKHAAATLVEIELRGEGTHLIVTVRDNGKGFDLDETLASRERGLGLFGMQERAQLTGGYLDLRSEPGAGTTVTLVVPLHEDLEP
ncbi:MAG: GAF domain-containing protein [Dehalococcoidia bacterium]